MTLNAFEEKAIYNKMQLQSFNEKKNVVTIKKSTIKVIITLENKFDTKLVNISIFVFSSTFHKTLLFYIIFFLLKFDHHYH